MRDLNYLYYIKRQQLFEEYFADALKSIQKNYFKQAGKYKYLKAEEVRYSDELNDILESLKGLKFVVGVLDYDYPLNEQIDTAILSFEADPKFNIKAFNELRNMIRHITKEIQEDFSELRTISSEEIERLDESLVCLCNYCYYSVVLNAAVAVESRLRKILCKTKSDKAMLGKLISELENKNSIGGIHFPEKYQALLKMLNKYRILAAHSKKEFLDHHVASAIFHLSIEFLLDSRWYKRT